ncbi:carbonic anhydrase [Clostridium sp. SM-530-WT-3G]|uniref:carbonic anhydrase n=1 Tax=Clostridium sp. SM-530-WT-3G TaxID=2725303 RepID=UPI00198183F8|nr:carbonic anhydrase [Clostridium sp. SM-530-WT-3G]
MMNKLAMILLLPILFIVGRENTPLYTSHNSMLSSKSDIEKYITKDEVITDSNEALEKLKEGNKRFINDKSQLINVTSERRNQLEESQNPYAVIVSCADSRVTPSLIFNCGLGEIFNISIAGNVIDEDALGSIEYGAEHLHAPLLVIMGHENCGAVTAAYDKLKNGTEAEGNINAIVDKILPNIKYSKNLNDAIKDNITGVYNEVLENKIVKNLVQQGKLKVVKAYYDLDGTVEFQ